MIIADDDALPNTLDELLGQAASRVPGNPVSLSIRRLLQYWDAKRRGFLITDEIKRDLDR